MFFKVAFFRSGINLLFLHLANIFFYTILLGTYLSCKKRIRCIYIVTKLVTVCKMRPPPVRPKKNIVERKIKHDWNMRSWQKLKFKLSSSNLKNKLILKCRALVTRRKLLCYHDVCFSVQCRKINKFNLINSSLF